MGQTQSNQTQSNQMSIDQIYSLYIQQQQNMIAQQQHQINELYKMNLNQQVPTNISFQQHHQQPDNTLKKLPSTKLDPYKILGLPKQYNETLLKKAYLKKAMKAHPDRGGSKDEFQKVSIAYTVLKKKLKEQGEIHHHNELRDNSQTFMKSQPTQHISANDNFDVAVFNKIYEDNRIDEAYDDGYGSWMQSTNDQISNKQISNREKMFQGEFNKDMFNHEFQKYKQEQKQKMGSQIVQYNEPQVRLSMKNQDSLAILGQGKINNFSGEVGNLGFCDYKAAFTTDSTLIDESSVNINTRATSIKGVEQERSNISYKMSLKDQQNLAYQEALEKKQERARIQRLQVYDQKGEDMYNKVHQMLLK